MTHLFGKDKEISEIYAFKLLPRLSKNILNKIEAHCVFLQIASPSKR